jgi:hypothetical protein
VLPEGIITIGDEAFCLSGLISITIPSTVTSIGREDHFNYFHGARVESFDVHPDNPIVKSVDGALYSKDGKTLIRYNNGSLNTTYRIPDGVTSVYHGAFLDSENIEEIIFPGSLTEIKNYVFVNCTSLKTVSIPDSVKDLGTWAFEYCTSLESIKLPAYLKRIHSSIFNGCSSLASIQLPRGIEAIEFRAFKNCTALKSIVIPRNVKSIDSEAFLGCSELTVYCESADIPGYGWPKDVKKVILGYNGGN